MTRSWSSICYGDHPKPETLSQKVGRMADLIRRNVTSSGAVTRDDLVAQFGEADVATHYRAALRRSGVHRLRDTL